MNNVFNFECVFKGLSKRDGGEFVNENGQKIEYDACYVIKVDEDVDGNICERRLKFPVTNKKLFEKLHDLNPYSKICLACEVQLFTGNAKVTPIDLVNLK